MKGYRKLIIGLIFLIVGLVVMYSGVDKDVKKMAFDFLIYLAGILIAGNGVEHIKEAIKRG